MRYFTADRAELLVRSLLGSHGIVQPVLLWFNMAYRSHGIPGSRIPHVGSCGQVGHQDSVVYSFNQLGGSDN